jgi:hypothetical protein
LRGGVHADVEAGNSANASLAPYGRKGP